jgi:hypothetical protein
MIQRAESCGIIFLKYAETWVWGGGEGKMLGNLHSFDLWMFIKHLKEIEKLGI